MKLWEKEIRLKLMTVSKEERIMCLVLQTTGSVRRLGLRMNKMVTIQTRVIKKSGRYVKFDKDLLKIKKQH